MLSSKKLFCTFFALSLCLSLSFDATLASGGKKKSNNKAGETAKKGAQGVGKAIKNNIGGNASSSIQGGANAVKDLAKGSNNTNIGFLGHDGVAEDAQKMDFTEQNGKSAGGVSSYSQDTLRQEIANVASGQASKLSDGAAAALQQLQKTKGQSEVNWIMNGAKNALGNAANKASVDNLVGEALNRKVPLPTNNSNTTFNDGFWGGNAKTTANTEYGGDYSDINGALNGNIPKFSKAAKDAVNNTGFGTVQSDALGNIGKNNNLSDVNKALNGSFGGDSDIGRFDVNGAVKGAVGGVGGNAGSFLNQGSKNVGNFLGSQGVKTSDIDKFLGNSFQGVTSAAKGAVQGSTDIDKFLGNSFQGVTSAAKGAVQGGSNSLSGLASGGLGNLVSGGGGAVKNAVGNLAGQALGNLGNIDNMLPGNIGNTVGKVQQVGGLAQNIMSGNFKNDIGGTASQLGSLVGGKAGETLGKIGNAASTAQSFVQNPIGAVGNMLGGGGSKGGGGLLGGIGKMFGGF